MHEALLKQARGLATRDPRRPVQANLRRAVSSAYYALFHLLTAAAAERLVPAGVKDLRPRIVRAFTHENLRRASTAFSSGGSIPMLGTIAVPPELRHVAAEVLELQQARNQADYDLSRRFLRTEVIEYVEAAERAVSAWAAIKNTDAAKVYLLLLLTYGLLKDR